MASCSLYTALKLFEVLQHLKQSNLERFFNLLESFGKHKATLDLYGIVSLSLASAGAARPFQFRLLDLSTLSCYEA